MRNKHPPYNPDHESDEGLDEKDAGHDPEGMSSRTSSFMKKALTVGVGALFLTEESLRSVIGEGKLPKEILSGILDSANKTKTEFLQNLSRDVREKVIDKIDPLALVQEFLSRNEVEFTIRLNVKPKKAPKV